MRMIYPLSSKCPHPPLAPNHHLSRPTTLWPPQRKPTLPKRFGSPRIRSLGRGWSETWTEKTSWMSSVVAKKRIYLRWCVSTFCTIEATHSSLETRLAIYPHQSVKVPVSRSYSSSTKMTLLSRRRGRMKARTKRLESRVRRRRQRKKLRVPRRRQVKPWKLIWRKLTLLSSQIRSRAQSSSSSNKIPKSSIKSLPRAVNIRMLIGSLRSPQLPSTSLNPASTTHMRRRRVMKILWTSRRLLGARIASSISDQSMPTRVRQSTWAALILVKTRR